MVELRIMNKGFIALPVLIFIAALAIAAGGYFGVVVKNTTTQLQLSPEPVEGRADTTDTVPTAPTTAADISGWQTYPSTSSGQVAIDTSDWKLYRNEKYGFGFKYPRDFALRQNPTIIDWSVPVEEGTASTFWNKIGKSRWQEKLAKKNSYQIGAQCTTNPDNFEESCTVISLSPYVMKYVVQTATGKVNTYEVVSDPIQVIFGPIVPPEGAVHDGASDQILSTFRFLE